MQICKTCLVSKLLGNNSTNDYVNIGDSYRIVPFLACRARYHPSMKIPRIRFKWFRKLISK